MKDCPRCHSANLPDALSCARCGGDLPAGGSGGALPSMPVPRTGIPNNPTNTPTGSAPIRVTLPGQQRAEASSEGEPQEGIPSHTALAVGAVVLLSCLVAPIAVAVFSGLGMALALLHHAADARRRPLEAYGTAVPKGLEAALGFLRRPDGKVVLFILMLAVAVFLAPKVVFGLAGAAALVTVLHLLDALHKPAERAMNWLNDREEAMRQIMTPLLKPAVSLIVSALASFPAVWFLVHQQRVIRLPWGRAGEVLVAGGAVTVAVALNLLWWRFRAAQGSRGNEGKGGAVLLCAVTALALAAVSAAVQLAALIRLPLVADRWLLNGLVLGLASAGGLMVWLRNYLVRTESNDAEASTWPASAWAALTASISGWLLCRAAAIDLAQGGVSPVAAVGLLSLAVWFAGSRALLAWVRRDHPGVVREWVMVFLCGMASVYVVFFGGWFGGLWGGIASCYVAVRIWQEGARLLREGHPPASSEANA